MHVWIGRNGERFGPYDEDEVKRWLRDGTTRPDELGWYEGMTDWRPLGELFPDARPEAPAATPPPPPFVSVGPSVMPAAEPAYASFWTRVGAWVIDYLILMVPFTIVAMAMGLGAAMTAFLASFEHDQAAAFAAYATTVRPISFVLMAVGFVYYVFFESSKWQATPGKLVLGIRVTDVEGRRLSVGRAAGRNAIRLVNVLSSLVPFVFYIVAAFTQRRQGVHDMLAGTYVLVGRAGQVVAPAPTRSGGTPGSFDA